MFEPTRLESLLFPHDNLHFFNFFPIIRSHLSLINSFTTKYLIPNPEPWPWLSRFLQRYSSPSSPLSFLCSSLSQKLRRFRPFTYSETPYWMLVTTITLPSLWPRQIFLTMVSIFRPRKQPGGFAMARMLQIFWVSEFKLASRY